MFAIQLATGFTFNEVKEIFKKIPGTVEFSHTDGPATNILVKLPGYENDRLMHCRWIGCFEPALAGHFGKFEVVEI